MAVQLGMSFHRKSEGRLFITTYYLTETSEWQMRCFQCRGASYLFGSGLLSCMECLGHCTSCQRPLEAVTIAAGDVALCGDCFRCRHCQAKIRDLNYVRTSQGVFCVICKRSLMARRRTKNTETALDLHKKLNTNFNEIVPRLSRERLKLSTSDQWYRTLH